VKGEKGEPSRRKKAFEEDVHRTRSADILSKRKKEKSFGSKS